MIKFTGTYVDFAHFHADYLRQTGHDFYTCANMNTLDRQLKIYQKFYPEMIQEVQIVAADLQVDPELLLYEELAAAVDQQRHRANHHQHGCTIFAIHENGQTFVGRNYDWLPAARGFFERYDLALTGANRYFAFSDEGVWRRHTGKNTRKAYFEDTVNEHGLYIGLTYAHADKWNYGLKPYHLIRYVAEKCSTTRQALAALRRMPHCIPKNYLIADASGDIAVFESTSRTYAVTRPDASGVVVKTNHFLAPELQKYERILADNSSPTSFVRHAEARHLIAQQMPGFQFTDLWRILRNSHYVYNTETIWSLALELSSQRFNIYSDTAMGQKQQKFAF